MATEGPQKLAENTESDSALNKTGTMSFPGDDPRHKPYVLEGWDLPPRGPRSANWKTHIAGLRSLELREDDIFLLAYPKAGRGNVDSPVISSFFLSFISMPCFHHFINSCIL